MSYLKSIAQKQTSRSSPEVSRASVSTAAVLTSRRFSRGVQEPDVDAYGEQRRGNLAAAVREVTFPYADRDYFVAHGLGRRVNNFQVIKRIGDHNAVVRDGQTRPNANKLGNWLRCDTAGATVHIKFHGQRADQQGG